MAIQQIASNDYGFERQLRYTDEAGAVTTFTVRLDTIQNRLYILDAQGRAAYSLPYVLDAVNATLLAQLLDLIGWAATGVAPGA